MKIIDEKKGNPSLKNSVTPPTPQAGWPLNHNPQTDGGWGHSWIPRAPLCLDLSNLPACFTADSRKILPATLPCCVSAFLSSCLPPPLW